MRKPIIVAFYGRARTEKARITNRQFFTIHHSPIIIDLGAMHRAAGTVSSEIFLGFFAVLTANGQTIT